MDVSLDMDTVLGARARFVVRRLGPFGGPVVAIAVVALLVAHVTLAADGVVTIEGSAFAPGSLTVAVGETVTWTNAEVASHTATADGGAFDTGTIATGGSRTVTFPVAATIPYHCSIHPDMHGTIVVEALAPSGGAVSSTPAPTDTVAAAADLRGDPVAAILIVLGLSMLLGTLVADRRLARRDRDSR